MNKFTAYLKKLKNKRFGVVKPTHAATEATDEQLIFPAETFLMPAIKDIFGQPHSSFMDRKASIPPFYVRSFKNAFCFTNSEEVYSSEKNVIVEHTSQKANPKIGESKKVFYRTKKRKIQGSAVHLSLSGLENNYYHFLTECLSRVYLLERSKFKPEYYIISNHLPFQAEMLELIGIDKDRVIPTNANLLLQVETMVVPDLINNWAYVHYRGVEAFQKQWQPTWLVNLYREKISLLEKGDFKGTKIYASRDKARYRTFENRDEVNALFTQLGFEIYYLEEMSVAKQIEAFANAAHIVGVHGAGLANLYFANRNAKVLELFPEYYHDTSYRILSTAQGLDYSYLTGVSADTGVDPIQENLYIDINRLKEALLKFIG
ncbi:glycosyltransferase family 61 protein [Mucilaginibacter lutimaris]|uniref:Glycosyltransferase family 61 protein n=1 Tax=Mucilaginibacter lutimaris TaxID=931629 RepID=A0ABW2ZLZ0_9SPHI